MKIDRRSFLAFGIGGAAGTALSPLPWKLTDESSIWSQMWPWVPVPVDGKAEYAHSTCLLCPGGCGITVRKIDNRAVKIEGREGHPINQGGICILGAAGLQFLYGPSRVKTPLKRVGERGEGRWEPISWEAALTELAEKLGTLRAEGRPEGVACISGSETGTVPALLKRFLTAYGSPNFIGPASAQTVQNAAMAIMTGGDGRVTFDVDKADFILSFGCDLLDGWGSPAQMLRTYGNRKERQAEITQIDYRLSNTAAKADRFIQINPGTEGALALGVIHKIIAEAAYNPSFVNQFTAGFEPFKQKVMTDFTPAKVTDITGVSTDVLTEIATKFAAAKRPLALCGRGRGSMPGAFGDTMAIMALNALVGNLNAEGGIHILPSEGYITWADPEMDDIASKGMAQKRLDGATLKDFFLRSMPHRMFQTGKSNPSQLPELLLVADANPLYTYRDLKTVKAAFEKIPFIASFSSFRDETAQFADLILPNHIYLERYQDVPAPPGATRPFIGLTQPVVAPQYNTKHLGDVIIDLAGRLNGSVADTFEWENYEACLKETLDWKWEGMDKDGFWTDSHYVAPAWDAMFKTASGQFELSSDKIDASWKASEPEGDSGQFPLLLLSYESIRLASGSLGNPPFVTKTVADTVLKNDDMLVELSRDTAHEYGLKEGSKVMLTTPLGEAKVRVHLSDGIKPGIVAMPTGLGHTAFDEFLAGKGANFNTLMGPAEDAASGFDAAWGIRAKLVKA